MAEEYSRLVKHFGGTDTIEALRRFVASHTERDFVALLGRLEIFYKSFHYD